MKIIVHEIVATTFPIIIIGNRAIDITQKNNE